MQSAEKARKSGDHKTALSLSLKSLEYLPYVEEREDIPVLPTVISCYNYFAALRRRDLIRNLHHDLQVIVVHPNYYEMVHEALDKANMADRIIRILDKEPGIEQSDIWKKLNVSGKSWSGFLKYMAGAGVIRKEKSGNTYKLHIGEEEISLKEAPEKQTTNKETPKAQPTDKRKGSGCSTLTILITLIMLFLLYFLFT